MSLRYNPITGEEVQYHRLPPEHGFANDDTTNNLEGGFRPLNEGDTDDEDLGLDYSELKELYDDVYPFQHAGNPEMSIREKFDRDVATPYLFGKLVGGSLTVDQAKRLGDIESRRKLYRELTSLFQGDVSSL